MYKGRRRSHRFTILGDSSFEYDCILNREPESNVITLVMEGAERFDFFRQPDFVKDPFLKGSYAVYKKETLIGEGTGKLCHIHRPQIIDAWGRWVWGDLSITGNKLCITIPETWLSEAKYPVVVDPTIGTTTVGSQTLWDADPPEPWVPLTNEVGIPVNRFPVNETINGLCTAYFYVYSNEEPESAGYPVLYSDNNNTPLTRRSAQESYIDLQVKSGKPAGWRSGTMRSNGSIAGGNYVWFGISTEYFWYSRFDYGSKSYCGDNSDSLLPTTYPLYNASYYNNFKFSMYFTYTSAQNYTRTLTQGVTLTDTRKLAGAYKRTVVMNGQNMTTLGHGSAYYRKQTATVKPADFLSRIKGYCCTIAETLKATDLTGYYRDFLRKVEGMVRINTNNGRIVGNNRTITSTSRSTDSTARGRGFFRTIATLLYSGDTSVPSMGLLRRLPDLILIADTPMRINEYIRGLYTVAGSLAETSHKGEYYRKQTDTVSSHAVSLRHLFIFIRLLTTGLVRDFIIRRFLKSNEEIVLKSPVCREIEIESTLH
jgi:hypothetical protein